MKLNSYIRTAVFMDLSIVGGFLIATPMWPYGLAVIALAVAVVILTEPRL
ncbi:MAG: hypothetical protein WC565_07590 [Parcubacteria group bacterium]